MKWGFLSVTHIISLVVAAGIIAGLYFALRNRNERTQRITLGLLSFSGLAAIVYNLLAWNSPLEYLPLHLCSLNALVLPAAVFTKNKTLNNLLLLWSFGAAFALILNLSVAEASVFSWVFAFYYFPHVLEIGIPILMFSLGLAKKDVKCVASTMLITISSYTVIHFINLLINDYAAKNNILDSYANLLRVNYMFSITPENPLLALFYAILPHPYWYMYLSFVLIALYLVGVYFKDVLRWMKKR